MTCTCIQKKYMCERETGRGEGERERESVKSKINLQLVS